MKKIEKTIKNSDCWDWAYVCATFGGKCESCPVYKEKMCAFCAYKVAQEFGEVKFTTHLYFYDIEKDILIQHMNRIIKEKWGDKNEDNNK